MCNTGYCWKAHINGEGSTLSGGPLSHDYQLAQYHCHWGQGIHHRKIQVFKDKLYQCSFVCCLDDTVGAEHLVNGHSYAAEVREQKVSFSLAE